jgi:hypothetical protein
LCHFPKGVSAILEAHNSQGRFHYTEAAKSQGRFHNTKAQKSKRAFPQYRKMPPASGRSCASSQWEVLRYYSLLDISPVEKSSKGHATTKGPMWIVTVVVTTNKHNRRNNKQQCCK